MWEKSDIVSTIWGGRLIGLLPTLAQSLALGKDENKFLCSQKTMFSQQNTAPYHLNKQVSLIYRREIDFQSLYMRVSSVCACLRRYLRVYHIWGGGRLLLEYLCTTPKVLPFYLPLPCYTHQSRILRKFNTSKRLRFIKP